MRGHKAYGKGGLYRKASYICSPYSIGGIQI